MITLLYINHKQIPVEWLQQIVLPCMQNIFQLLDPFSISNPSENFNTDHLLFFPGSILERAKLNGIISRNKKSQEHQVKGQGHVIVQD